jgi:hypothetical protein
MAICASRGSENPYFIGKIRLLVDRESSVEPMQLDRRSLICHGLKGVCSFREQPKGFTGRRMSVD